MIIVNEASKTIKDDMFTSNSINSCEYDSVSCGCGN